MKQLSDTDIEQMSDGVFIPDDAAARKSVRAELKLSKRIPAESSPLPKQAVLDLHQHTEEQAWNEIMNIGIATGAKMVTFLDLCGIGDLFLSATSATSRNFAGGMAIARGEKPEGTVEGIFALHGLIQRADNLNIDVPVLKEMQKKLNI